MPFSFFGFAPLNFSHAMDERERKETLSFKKAKVLVKEDRSICDEREEREIERKDEKENFSGKVCGRLHEWRSSTISLLDSQFSIVLEKIDVCLFFKPLLKSQFNLQKTQ